MARTSLILTALAFLSLEAQAPAPDPVSPDPNSPRPISARDTVFMEDMTWMEIRDAMRAGKLTAIVATGGIEQNGPYLAAGKHNVVLRLTTDAIARNLGDALVAPIVPFVPEGDIDPPTIHMKYPSTFSVTEETYRSLLTQICACLRTHGFRRIVLIGDSGGNQKGMEAVASDLNAKWAGNSTKLYVIKEYYNYPDVTKWLATQGIAQTDQGLHDDFAITAQMAAIDPASIRTEERIKAGKFRINGVELSPIEKTAEWGRRIADFRASITIDALRHAMKANE
jgi:creatinine amidohydrolase/Fe(II)-dependent formamide hydrolase-like protein